MSVIEALKIPAIFVAAVLIAWWPLNKFIPWLWKVMALLSDSWNSDPSSKMAPAVGGLERTLYIFATMADKFELITGWLILKAFLDGLMGGRGNPNMTTWAGITDIFLGMHFRCYLAFLWAKARKQSPGRIGSIR